MKESYLIRSGQIPAMRWALAQCWSKYGPNAPMRPWVQWLIGPIWGFPMNGGTPSYDPILVGFSIKKQQ